MKIDTNEIIGCQSWYDLCDYNYEEVDTYPTGVVLCFLDQIEKFFREIEDNGEEYVVVSPRSDFGLCYQKEFPIFRDIEKAVKMFARPNWGYETVQLPPRCDVDNCNIGDKYSIKAYMWTRATFNHIPSNVKYWFMTNCAVQEPNLEGIPFGIFNTGGSTKFFEYYDKVDIKPSFQRKKKLYVNFQLYTMERIEIIRHYINRQSISNTDFITMEKDVSFEKYMNQLNNHRYCLCPISNGFDSYRILECLYMRCIPIVEMHPGLEYLKNANLPVVWTDLNGIKNITEYELDQYYQERGLDIYQSELTEAKLSYWKQKINDQRNNLQQK